MSASVFALGWVVVGLGLAATLLDSRDRREFFTALLATILWPASLVALCIGKYRRAKDERARQDRITAAVARGEYTLEDAKRLKWKGPRR